jgi:hypothetical protein
MRFISPIAIVTLTLIHVASLKAQVWSDWGEIRSNFKIEISNERWGNITDEAQSSKEPSSYEIELDIYDIDLDGEFNFGFGTWFRNGNNTIPSGESGYQQSGLGVQFESSGSQVLDVPYNLYAYSPVDNAWVGLMGGGTMTLKAGDHVRFRAYYDFPTDAVNIKFRLLGTYHAIPDRENAKKEKREAQKIAAQLNVANLNLATNDLTRIDSLIALGKFSDAIERLEFCRSELPGQMSKIDSLMATVKNAQTASN